MAARRQTRSQAHSVPHDGSEPPVLQPPVTQRQRKRGRTGSASEKPPAKRPTGTKRSTLTTAATASSPDNTNQHVPGLSPASAPEAQHSYGTRRSNDPHPAQSAGVAKRTQAQIKEAAAAKQAEKQSKVDARQEVQEREAYLEAIGSATLAELFGARMMSDEEHDNNLSNGQGWVQSLLSRVPPLTLSGPDNNEH